MTKWKNVLTLFGVLVLGAMTGCSNAAETREAQDLPEVKAREWAAVSLYSGGHSVYENGALITDGKFVRNAYYYDFASKTFYPICERENCDHTYTAEEGGCPSGVIGNDYGMAAVYDGKLWLYREDAFWTADLNGENITKQCEVKPADGYFGFDGWYQDDYFVGVENRWDETDSENHTIMIRLSAVSLADGTLTPLTEWAKMEDYDLTVLGVYEGQVYFEEYIWSYNEIGYAESSRKVCRVSIDDAAREILFEDSVITGSVVNGIFAYGERNGNDKAPQSKLNWLDLETGTVACAATVAGNVLNGIHLGDKIVWMVHEGDKEGYVSYIYDVESGALEVTANYEWWYEPYAYTGEGFLLNGSSNDEYWYISEADYMAGAKPTKIMQDGVIK